MYDYSSSNVTQYVFNSTLWSSTPNYLWWTSSGPTSAYMQLYSTGSAMNSDDIYSGYLVRYAS